MHTKLIAHEFKTKKARAQTIFKCKNVSTGPGKIVLVTNIWNLQLKFTTSFQKEWTSSWKHYENTFLKFWDKKFEANFVLKKVFSFTNRLDFPLQKIDASEIQKVSLNSSKNQKWFETMIQKSKSKKFYNKINEFFMRNKSWLKKFKCKATQKSQKTTYTGLLSQFLVYLHTSTYFLASVSTRLLN